MFFITEGPNVLDIRRTGTAQLIQGAAYKEKGYGIEWIDKHGHPHRVDPYIQVKPW